MIELLQAPSFAIGSADAITALAKKDAASLLVVSDSHGRSDILRAIVERFGKKCDALVFCGDGIGDLCSCLESARKNKRLMSAIPPVVVFVRGNGDYPEFPFGGGEITVPLRAVFKAAGMNIMATHGHSEGAYYGLGRMTQEAQEIQADVVFYGHTHIAARQEDECAFFINPGSCSHPRGGQPPSFAIVQIPGMTERFETVFYSIVATLADGLDFVPYAPLPRW